MLRTRVPYPPWATTPSPCAPPPSSQRRDTIDCTGRDHHPDGTPPQLWSYHGRPWALGQTRQPTSWLTVAAGTCVRRPGCYPRVDPATNRDTREMLLRTGERVHASVRVRLALGGLALDDRRTWACDALRRDDSGRPGRAVWTLTRVPDSQWLRDDEVIVTREKPSGDGGGDDGAVYTLQDSDGRWQWEYEADAVVKNGENQRVFPLVPVLPEEPMAGYWERHLLALMEGEVDVWRLAETIEQQRQKSGQFTRGLLLNI